MHKANEIMKNEIEKMNFQEGRNMLISNVTAEEITSAIELKNY